MTRKISKITFLTAALLSQTSALYAVNLTDAQELALVKGIHPHATRLATSAVWPSEATDDMDSSKFGTLAMTAASDIYWRTNGSDLYTMSYVGDVWRTFLSSGVAASWSATGAVTLTENKRNGATPGGGTEYTAVLTLTKTGSPADLTQAELFTFLKASRIKALSTTAGTGLALTGNPKVGWAVNAVIKNEAAAGVSSTLGAVQAVYTLPLTLSDGTALTLSAAPKSLDTWNLATNSTTKKSVLFTAPGYSMNLEFMPGPMVRTAGVETGIVTVAANLVNRFLDVNEAAKRFTLYNQVNDLPSIVKGRYVTTDDSDVASKMRADAVAKLSKAAIVAANFVTTADTNNYGLAAIGATDITSVTWTNDGSTVVATGTIGTGIAKEFRCSLSGQTVIKDDTNNVLEFVSADGDSFIVKCFDAAGLDTSAVNDYGAGMQDDLLAAELVTKLTGTGTIDAKAIDAL